MEAKLKERDLLTSESQKLLTPEAAEKVKKRQQKVRSELDQLKSKLVAEQRKANSAVEKRQLIVETCENCMEWQNRLQEELPVDTVPLDPNSVQKIIGEIQSKKQELLSHRKNHVEKVEQLKKHLDQSKEPFGDELLLAEDLIQSYERSLANLDGKIEECKIAKKQREELLATLDKIDSWVAKTRKLINEADEGEFCRLDSILAQVKVKINCMFLRAFKVVGR